MKNLSMKTLIIYSIAFLGLFDIYSKENWRIIMAKKISGENKINDTTLHELLLMIDAKLNHLEDISADNRAIIVKLVKQSNQVVKFLKTLEIEINETYEQEPILSYSSINEKNTMSEEKLLEVKALVEELKEKGNELKEFEKELSKNKDKLTPGQIGEA